MMRSGCCGPDGTVQVQVQVVFEAVAFVSAASFFFFFLYYLSIFSIVDFLFFHIFNNISFFSSILSFSNKNFPTTCSLFSVVDEYSWHLSFLGIFHFISLLWTRWT